VALLVPVLAEASVAKPQTARGIVHYARQQGTKRA